MLPTLLPVALLLLLLLLRLAVEGHVPPIPSPRIELPALLAALVVGHAQQRHHTLTEHKHRQA